MKDSKEAVQNSIAQKMQQIHGNCFDLTEEEIDQWQEELEFEYDEGSEEDVRSNMKLEDQETYADSANLHTNADDVAKTGDPSALLEQTDHMNDGLNEGRMDEQNNSFQWLEDANGFPQPKTSKVEFDENEQHKISNDFDHDQQTYADSANLNTNADDDHEREIEPNMSSVDVTNENTNNQNDLDNIPMFSPTSTSVSNT